MQQTFLKVWPWVDILPWLFDYQLTPLEKWYWWSYFLSKSSQSPKLSTLSTYMYIFSVYGYYRVLPWSQVAKRPYLVVFVLCKKGANLNLTVALWPLPFFIWYILSLLLYNIVTIFCLYNPLWPIPYLGSILLCIIVLWDSPDSL